MVKNFFLLEYARLIADFPDQVDIKEEQIDDNFYELTIFANKSDAGKLIGDAVIIILLRLLSSDVRQKILFLIELR